MPRWLKANFASGQIGASGGQLRLDTSVRLRWFAVFGQLLTIVVVYFGLGFDLPIGLCLATIASSAWLNIILRIVFAPGYRVDPRFSACLLVYDTLQLSVLLYLTGGMDNPFAFLLVAPVTVSAATQPIAATLLLAVLTAALAIILTLTHHPLPWFPGQSLDLPDLYKAGMLASALAGMGFLAFYVWRLAREAGQMSAALAATESVLAREQRLHALDGLAAAAAHELGTPLSTITVVAKELSREVPPGTPLGDDLALIQSQAMRCREIMQKLTRSPTERDPMHAHLSVSQLIEEAAAPYRDLKAKIVVDTRPADGCPEPSRPEPTGERLPGMIHGLANLIENAADFAATEVTITGRWSDRDVSVTVTDDGPGFAANVMESLGEPYVTSRSAKTRPPGDAAGHSGLGLGFFIAKTLLERSGARVSLENRPLRARGAIVRVQWPRAKFEETEAGTWRLRRNAPAY